jgi:hypothetical protein
MQFNSDDEPSEIHNTKNIKWRAPLPRCGCLGHSKLMPFLGCGEMDEREEKREA